MSAAGPIPPLRLLEDPSENEEKLWRMIVMMRRSLQGDGGPFPLWGQVSGCEGQSSEPPPSGAVLMFGCFGQITTDDSCTIYIDFVNKRVGINTCSPQYTVDIYSVECGSNVQAWHNNGDIDLDFFPWTSPDPLARIRGSSYSISPLEGTPGRLQFYTVNGDEITPPTMVERLRVDQASGVDVRVNLSLSGDISDTVSGSHHNYDPTGFRAASVLRLTASSAATITGLDSQLGSLDGSIKTIHNVGSNDITLAHQHTSSMSYNRFALPNAVDLVVPSGASVTLWYDFTSQRWRAVWAAGAGVGSGVAGRVAFWSAPTTLTSDSGFLWDATNDMLQIGQSNPDGFYTGRAMIVATRFGSTANEIVVGHHSDTAQAIFRGNIAGAEGAGNNTKSGSLVALATRGRNTTGGFISGGNIQLVASENWTTSAVGTRFDVFTIPNGTTSGVNSLRVDQDATVILSNVVSFKSGGTNAMTLTKAADGGARTVTFPDRTATVIMNAGNNDFGAFFQDFSGISTPADPGAGVRRLFVDSGTGELSVRTSGGTTVSLESGGGGGTHNLLDGTTHPDTLAGTVVAGDIIIGNATPKWSRLGVGTNGQVLTVVTGAPAWASPGGGTTHTLLNGATHTDTVAQTVSAGSLVFGNSTPAWDELVIGTNGQVLTVVSGAPAWATPSGGGGAESWHPFLY